MNEQIATIVPLDHLTLLNDDSYLMALAHIAEADNDYMNYFMEHSHTGSTVILDNSAVELGKPMYPRYLFTLARCMGAAEVVLPDYYRNAPQTVRAVREAVAMAKDEYTGRLMGVPQGSSWNSWNWCLKELIAAGVDTIGLSYRATEMLGGSRVPMASQLSGQGIAVHLLGSGVDPADEIAPALKIPGVRGVDSAVAAVFAKHGQMYTGSGTRPPRTVDFLSDHYDEKLLSKNIANWRGRCRNGLNSASS